MKIIYIIIGFITLILGVIGAIIPLLPTTPFLLVTAFCFMKGSEKLNTWFKQTKLYQDNLESFAKGNGMSKKTKIRILTMVTILMCIAAYFMRNTLPGLICLGCVWLAHIIGFIFFIKTAD